MTPFIFHCHTMISLHQLKKIEDFQSKRPAFLNVCFNAFWPGVETIFYFFFLLWRISLAAILILFHRGGHEFTGMTSSGNYTLVHFLWRMLCIDHCKCNTSWNCVNIENYFLTLSLNPGFPKAKQNKYYIIETFSLEGPCYAI